MTWCNSLSQSMEGFFLFHFFIFSWFHWALDQASSYESSLSEGLRDKWQLVLKWRVVLYDGHHLEMGFFLFRLLWPKIPRLSFFIQMTLNFSTFLSWEHCTFLEYVCGIFQQLKVIPVSDNQFHACIIHTHYLKLPWCKMLGGMTCVCMKSIMDLYIFLYSDL